MEKVCSVLAGKWKCTEAGEWNFVIDKGRFGRMVNVKERSTLEELCFAVGHQYGESNTTTSLSYWNESVAHPELGYRPPILLSSDGCVVNFFQKLLENSDRYLFVSFGGAVEGVECHGTVNTCDFVTPDIGIKRKQSTLSSCGASNQMSAKRVVFSSEGRRVFGPEDVVEVSKEFLNDVEAAEEKMMSSDRGRGSKRSGKEHVNLATNARVDEPSWNLLDEDDMSDGVEREVSDSDLRCRGYDSEFWEPLVNDDLCGSNAVEIMCSTNSCFDHRVVMGDVGEKYKDEFCGAGASAGEGVIPDAFQFDLNAEYCGVGDKENYDSQHRGHDVGVGNNNAQTRANFNPQNCGHSGGVGVNRKLHDVPDEEFDLEPLFDDMCFKRTPIPDLDRDEEDDDIYEGKTFLKKLDCQIALAIYAIKNMFYFKQTRTKRNYFVVTCADTNCSWRVTAGETKENSYYQIKKAQLHHSCGIETRGKYKKLASYKVIGELYRPKFVDADGGPKPVDLQQLLLEELRISCSYRKCWKAREIANEVNKGSEEDSYLFLLQYLHMLKEANPGTIADIETVDDGLGDERFLYLFLAFGASISGFRWLRRVIVIDGTHLTGKYKGVLLTASGQDANFQVFPLAFAVVDSEREESWSWFLKKIRDEIIADSPELVIISDKATSIGSSVKITFPKAKHGACIVHVGRNVVTKFKSKGLAKLVTEAAFSYRLSEFNKLFGKVKSINRECARYLEKRGLATWTRFYFPGQRYNMMTSNVAESLNNAMRKAKNSPITELLMFIQSMLSRWFGARKEKALKYGGPVTPEVDKVVTRNMRFAKASKVTGLSANRFEVIGEFGGRYNVDLKYKCCTCKMYDKLKIPCGHALVAAGSKDLPYGTLCGDYYRTSIWRKTYEGVVQPHEDPKEGVIPEEVLKRIVRPPKTRRPSGRPPVRRIKSTGEISKGSSSNKCGRCKKSGHNRTSCTEVI